MYQQSSPYPQQQWVPQPQAQAGYQQQQQPPYGYQVPVQPQQATALQAAPQGTAGQVQDGHRPGFDHDSQRRCGILQIIIGLTVLVVSVIMIIIGAGLYQLGFGIWTSPFFIIAGGLGVHSAKTKNTCPIVGCMVMSILSILAAVVVFSCGGGGLAQDDLFNNECSSLMSDRDFGQWTHYYPCHHLGRWRPRSQGELNARIAMNAINIIAGVAEFFVALVQSVFCCKGTCCGGPKPQQRIIVYQPTPQAQVPYNPQQPVVYPASQPPVMPVGQPYGGMPAQNQPQFLAQPPPPAANPDFTVQAAQPSAPPYYSEAVALPYKQ